MQNQTFSITKIPAKPQEKKRLRMAGYARVSADKDAAFHSLEQQVEYYSDYAFVHPEWDLIRVYSDNAISGTKAERPAFQQMLTDCRAGKIDLIVTKSITRFARNTVVLLETIRELKTLNIDVYFEKEAMHSISPDGELLLTLLAMYAEEEARSASENRKWRMYQVGVKRNQLRVSQFFSVDTIAVLVHLAEYDPSLMERVLRREPNAYLAVMYWDSEMFHRTTTKRRQLEGDSDKDYRALLKDMLFVNPDERFNTEHKRAVAKQYRKLFIRMDGMARPRDYRKMYEGLTAGDPKLRTLRAIYQDISGSYADYAKRFQNGGDSNGRS